MFGWFKAEAFMTTPILPQRILLVDNDPAAADEIRAALATAGRGLFELEWVRQLSAGLTRLNKGGIDAVLLDLSLPGTQGIETFDKLCIGAPDVPILILGSNANEALAK